MKKILFLCVTGALLCVGCATTAPPTYEGAQSITPAARAAIADGHADQVTCWREKPNGSHLTQKYCATIAERAAVQKQDQQSLFNMQTQGQAKCTQCPP
ncbi:MAG: hypothetical protein WBR29_01045 [Gammaproteobacteria bacterium]